MRDMLHTASAQQNRPRTGPVQHHHHLLQEKEIAPSKISDFNGEKGCRMKTSFADIFHVAEYDLRQERIEQTIKCLSQTQDSLQNVITMRKPLSAVSLMPMIQWNLQLSELCTPLVSHPVAGKLVAGIINMAFELSRKSLQNPLLLHPEFVLQIMMLPQDTPHQTAVIYQRLYTVSPLARQRRLVQLLDAIMKLNGQGSGGLAAPSKRDMNELCEASALFASPTEQSQATDDVGIWRLDFGMLEDIAGMAGEIPDWRFITVCILLVERILVKVDSASTRRPRELLDNTFGGLGMNEEDEEGMTSTFGNMVERACDLFQQSSSRTDNSADMTGLVMAQQKYILVGRPHQLTTRRRMSFLVGEAIARHKGFLIHQIRCHFANLNSLKDKGIISSNSFERPLVSFLARMIFAGDDDDIEANQGSRAAALKEQVASLLQQLHGQVLPHEQDSSGGLSFGGLEHVLHSFSPLVLLHVPLVADLICALGLFARLDDSAASWKPAIEVGLMTVSRNQNKPMTPLHPLMARFGEIADILDLNGLAQALNNIITSHNRSE
ncbi:hypothetical protein EDD11_008316 [Mortierella claussenii]|nr:hypothetical protein EDD11_008316 [Mortierella claussenii]